MQAWGSSWMCLPESGAGKDGECRSRQRRGERQGDREMESKGAGANTGGVE
jgi:hypothetical protein